MEISEIVNTIEDIASQTNLVASTPPSRRGSG